MEYFPISYPTYDIERLLHSLLLRVGVSRPVHSVPGLLDVPGLSAWPVAVLTVLQVVADLLTRAGNELFPSVMIIIVRLLRRGIV